jgi:hypothetical protein
MKSPLIDPLLDPLHSMSVLLERAGFRVRGRRADCAKCTGRSRLTVSFTKERAFSRRCHWITNRISLAWKLGLLSNNPRMREALRCHRERLVNSGPARPAR